MSADPLSALEDLLSSLYTPDGLRRALRRLGAPWAALVDALPGDPVAKTPFMHAAAGALLDQGLADAALYAALVEGFPRRAEDIRATERVIADRPRVPGRPRVAAPLPAVRPPPRPVRVLHLSDLHVHEKTSWDAGTVLDRLAGDVQRLREQTGGIDRVVVTGDVASSGKASEYEAAWTWLSGALAAAAGVGVAQIRVVPGNHDVDRGAISRSARLLTEGLLREEDPQQAAAEILGDPDERRPRLRRAQGEAEVSTVSQEPLRPEADQPVAQVLTKDQAPCPEVPRGSLDDHR